MAVADNRTFYSLDTPVGPIMLIPCLNPESDGEQPDVSIGQQCPEHNRSVYLCLDNSVLWCDGFKGEDDWAPHEIGLDPRGFRSIEA